MSQQHERWTPQERARLAAKLSTHVVDNGRMHYGMGMPGSLCGVHSPTRTETTRREKVNCPTCIGILKGRP
jgi:hypothetical protein